MSGNGFEHSGNGNGAPKLRADWIARRKADNSDGNFSQMHYARKGMVTEEMEYVAEREKLAPETGARRSGARAHDHPRQHQPSRAGAHGHRRGLAVQDQRQHRQLRRHLQHRRGTEEAAHLRALRRRHGDGPLHRRRHPRDPRSHPARTRPCPSAPCRSTRRSRGCRRVEDLTAADHAGSDRGAGRAGRGLHDHPRRRADRSTCR